MAFEPSFPEFESIRLFLITPDDPHFEGIAHFSRLYPPFSVTDRNFSSLGFLVYSTLEKAYVFVSHGTHHRFQENELREITLALWALRTTLGSKGVDHASV